MQLRSQSVAALAVAASLAGVVFGPSAARGAVVIQEIRAVAAGLSPAAGNGTYDRITFKVTSFTSPDDQTGPLGQPAGLGVLAGTFTAVGNNAVLAVPGDSVAADAGNGNYADYITSGKGGIGTINSDSGSFNYYASFVKLDSVIAGTTSRSGSGTSTQDDLGSVATINGTSASFGSNWFTSGTRVGVNGILAQIFVTPGADVNFTGTYSTYGSSVQPITFGAAVPEPTSLGLAGVATLGLLGRRRRQA